MRSGGTGGAGSVPWATDRWCARTILGAARSFRPLVLAPLALKLIPTAPRYLVLSKSLKFIIDIKYQYVIMV